MRAAPVEPARSRMVITWPDEVLTTLISQPVPQVVAAPPLELEELLELDELELEELELDEVPTPELLELELLLLLEELLDELLPDTTTAPAITVGTVGIPLVGFLLALAAMFVFTRLRRSLLLSWPSPFTSMGDSGSRAPVSGSRSKMNPEPPSSQEIFDGMSVANTSLPVERIGRSFTRSPVPVFDQVVVQVGCGVHVSAVFGRSRYQPSSGATVAVAGDPEAGPGEVALTIGQFTLQGASVSVSMRLLAV